MLVTQRGLSPTLAGFSLALGGVTWALGSWIQSKGRVEPYRGRLMVLGMLMVAAAIAGAPHGADRIGAGGRWRWPGGSGAWGWAWSSGPRACC